LKLSTFFRLAVFLLLPAALLGQPAPPAGPANLDFEQGQPGEVPPGWHLPTPSKDAGYAAEIVAEKPESGRQAARISVPGELKNPQMFGSLMTSFDATAWRGKRVRLRAAVRVEGGGQDQAALWLRVDRPGGVMGFFDNMANRPITLPEWKRYEIVGNVAPDAQAINLGMMMFGHGKAWIDSVSFEAVGEAGAGNEPARPLDARGLDNLAAFTRLFGYVRFFHPSDQAAAADWEKLALAGVQRAEKPRSPQELARALEDLFHPVAPTLRVFPTAGRWPALPAELRSKTASVVYWRHQGVKIGERPSIYKSERVDSGALPRSGEVQQAFTATPYRGQRVVARAMVRAAGGGSGVLRLKFYGKTDVPVTLAESPAATAGEWRVCEVAAEVPQEAMGLEVDLGLDGEGRVWWDDVTLEKAGNPGDAEPLDNTGFETAGYSGPSGWTLPWDSLAAGYAASLSEDRPRSGARSLLLAYSKPNPASFPRPGEPLVVDLGGGVSAMVPLALYKDARGTLPRSAGTVPAPDKPEGFTPTGDDRATRLADVALAWTVFQHFYPYFDVVKTDWPAELRRGLSAAATDADGQAFLITLRRLVAALHDGHGGVYLPSQPTSGQLPLLWDWVEDQLVVTRVAEGKAGELKPGDVVVSINGRPAREALAEAESLISGATPQWVRWNALRRLSYGQKDEAVRLEARHPGGGAFTAELTRALLPYGAGGLEESRPEKIAEVRPSIFYVDIGRINDDDFKGAVDRLAGAKGIVFDLRGYPSNLSTVVLAHLTDRPVSSARWNVPVVTRPDGQGWDWEVSGWAVQPQAPRFKARTAFLTDGRAISYAETYMGIVENYHLAEIVGGPTAGTNGNVNPFTLPGGYGVSWTGMKVLKHDGSQHHGIGIRPTVPVSRTIQGVADGRDEILEKAIKVVGK
jgi:C-terminal processing protease CtpA/Prc